MGKCKNVEKIEERRKEKNHSIFIFFSATSAQHAKNMNKTKKVERGEKNIKMTSSKGEAAYDKH